MTLAQGIAEFEIQLRADGRSRHTIGSYLRALRLMADWLSEDVDVATITSGKLARFVTSSRVALTREGRYKAAGSVNQTKTAVRVFFRFLVETDVLAKSPARALRMARTGRPPPQVLSFEESTRLLEAMRAGTTPAAMRDHVLFSVLLGTGIRVSAVVGLDVGDVRLEERRLVINGKGGTRGLAVFASRVAELLRGYLGGVDDGPVFRSRRGRRLSVRQVQYRLRRWLDAAGIEKRVTVHGLRHTFGTRLYQRSGDLRLVQRALHHRRVTTTEIYAHLVDERLSSAVERIAD